MPKLKKNKDLKEHQKWNSHYKKSNNGDKLKTLLGDRMRTIRKQRGYTQEELSFRCDLDKTYVASIEQGRRNVSFINLHKIANALGMTLSEFFKGL